MLGPDKTARNQQQNRHAVQPPPESSTRYLVLHPSNKQCVRHVISWNTARPRQLNATTRHRYSNKSTVATFLSKAVSELEASYDAEKRELDGSSDPPYASHAKLELISQPYPSTQTDTKCTRDISYVRKAPFER